MARILYGVMGDAGGHVSRSLAIARQLGGDEIVFVGGGSVAGLTQSGYTVVPVPVLGTVLRSQRVDMIATAIGAFDALRQRPSVIARLTAVIREFDPDLIVTDYEYFLPQAARRLGRSCISVDRQHVLTQCRYDVPGGHRVSRLLTLGLIRSLYSAASHYLVCSFVPLPPLDPALTEVMPPVLREDVYAVDRGQGDHAVVYVRGTSADWLRSLLGGRRRRYMIYGFDVEREEGNLLFRRTCTERFLHDLADCVYAVSNGGHNVISEALHYGKAVFCLPVGLFYEQLFNADQLAKAGYGAYHSADSGAASALDAFEARLPEFERRVTSHQFRDRTVVAERLRTLMRAG